MRHLLALLFALLALPAVAAEHAGRSGFWGDVDIGFGSLHLAPDIAGAGTNNRFYLGFAGGYTVHPQLQIGIEASGWSIRAGNLWDSSRGEGLRQLFGVVRYWPTENSELFLKFAGGSISHWNNEPGTSNGTGSGYTVGVGYELSRFAKAHTAWFLNYSAGSVTGYRPPGGVKQGEDFAAITAGLSLGF